MELHITLVSAALAAIINLWLSARCGRARAAAKVAHGDGGDAALMQAMRAHSNFTEYTPLTLVLIAAVELSGHGGWLLAATAIAFLLGRVLHGLGMVPAKTNWLRASGMLLTFLPILGLSAAAVLIAYGGL